MDLMTYLTLFGWSFLAATIVPLGSEIYLAAVLVAGHSPVLCVAIATAGNYLGACTTFWLGGKARQLAMKQPDAPPSRSEKLVTRYGAPVLILSWVPILGDAIVAVAGAMRVPFFPFTLWTVMGKLLRYAVVAYATLKMSAG
jgi:membrane protein YqaA with SNARE-associated domain